MHESAPRARWPSEEPGRKLNRWVSGVAWVVLALVFAATCYALKHPHILNWIMNR